MSSLERSSAESERGRDVPSFIEARPPLVTAPWLRPKPAHGTNLMDLYEDESMMEDAESDLVQVYLRLKPSKEPSTLYEIRSSTVLATVGDVLPSDHSRRTQCNVSKLHTFSHIFPDNATQQQLFEHIVKGNLRRLPEGHSYTLLTYGASGSGKTYTLMGTVEQPGLVPRSLEYLFRQLSPAQHPQYRPRDAAHETLTSAQQAYELELVSRLRRPAAPVRGARRAYRRMSQRLSGDFHSTAGLAERHTHYVWVSFVEIYNEAVYDLLQRTDRSKVASKLKIYEDPRGTVYVKGATQAFVRTGSEAYDVMSAGRLNLRVAATGVHAHSSRSHCIFTITLLTDTPEGVVSSCVRLCDLAGSERAERTQNAGVRMAESRAINSSLHVLERCLHVLRRKQRAASTSDAAANFIVPFRESKLTRLLGAPLSGASHEAVSMVVTVNPSPLYAQETRHVLQLAAIASEICVNTTSVDSTGLETTANSSADSSRDVELLARRAENERLHFEIERLYVRLEEANRTAASSREQSAATMRELVEEARDASSDYYTQQITLQDERHRREKERLMKQVEGLVIENTKLKEQLVAKPLELAVVESELEHLHACLAERDRADSGEGNAEVKGESVPASVVVLDSESDSDSEEESESEEETRLGAIPEESTLGSARSTLTSEDCSCDPITGVLKDDFSSDSETEDNKEIQLKNAPTVNHYPNVSININVTNTTCNKKCSPKVDRSIRLSIQNKKSMNQSTQSCANNESKDNTHNTSESYVKRHSSNINPAEEDISQINESFRLSTDAQVLSESYCNQTETVNDDTGKRTFTKFQDSSASHIGKKHSSIESAGIDNINEKNYECELNDSLKALDIIKTPAADDSVDDNQSDSKTSDILHCKESDLNLLPEVVKSEYTDHSNLTNEKSKNRQNISDLNITPQNYIESNKSLISSDVTKSLRNVCSHNNNYTFDSFSFPNISDQLMHTDGTTENKTNLFNSAIEVVLSEHKTFLMTTDVEKKTESNDMLHSTLTCNELQDSLEKLESKKELHNPGKLVEATQDESNKSNDKELRDALEKVDLKKELEDLVPEKPLEKTQDGSNDKELCKTLEKVGSKKELENSVPDNPLEKSLDASNESKDKKVSAVEGILSMCRLKSDLFASADTEGVANNISETETHQQCEGQSADVNQNDSTTADLPLSNDVRLDNTKDENCIKPTLESKFDQSTVYTETVLGSVENKQDNYVKCEDDNAVETVGDKSKHDNLKIENFGIYLEENTVPCSLDIHSVVGSINFNTNTKANQKTQSDVTVDPPCDTQAKEKQSKSIPQGRRKNLRLRKKTAYISDVKDEKTDELDVLVTEKTCKLRDRTTRKLKDIANLQQEFCDVTLGVPSAKREVKDIPSPDKLLGEENVPPSTAQSCPAKNACSRRKLYTPRAEPLDESVASDDDSNLRVRVPRPSYHRNTRARRKL